MNLHEEFIREYKIKATALPEDIQKAIRLFAELKRQLRTRSTEKLIELSGLDVKKKETIKKQLKKPVSAYSQKASFGSLSLEQAIDRSYFFWKEEINLFGDATYHLGYTRFDSITIPRTVFDIVNLPFRNEYQGDFQYIPNLEKQLAEAAKNIVLKVLLFLKEQVDLKPYLILDDKYQAYFERFELIRNGKLVWKYMQGEASYDYLELNSADSHTFSYGMIIYKQAETEEEIKFRINETAQKLEPITWTNYQKIARKYRNWKDKDPMSGTKKESVQIEGKFESWLSQIEGLKLEQFCEMLTLESAV